MKDTNHDIYLSLSGFLQLIILLLRVQVGFFFWGMASWLRLVSVSPHLWPVAHACHMLEHRRQLLKRAVHLS